jgi:hypothetical protein
MEAKKAPDPIACMSHAQTKKRVVKVSSFFNRHFQPSSLVVNMHRTAPHPLSPPPLLDTRAMELAKALQPAHLLPSLELNHANRALLFLSFAVHTSFSVAMYGKMPRER